MPPAIGGRSERVRGFPEAPILLDPCIRFGFGCKAGRLQESASSGYLDGEAVVVAMDHAIIHISHGYP